MTVPEAAMDEDYLFHASKYEVRGSWNIAAMEAITITQGVNDPTYVILGTVFVPRIGDVNALRVSGVR
jgi:hypothetical protein